MVRTDVEDMAGKYLFILHILRTRCMTWTQFCSWSEGSLLHKHKQTLFCVVIQSVVRCYWVNFCNHNILNDQVSWPAKSKTSCFGQMLHHTSLLALLESGFVSFKIMCGYVNWKNWGFQIFIKDKAQSDSQKRFYRLIWKVKQTLK